MASCTCLASGKLLLSLRVRSIMASYLRRKRRGVLAGSTAAAGVVCVQQHASRASSPAELGVTANCCHHLSPEQPHDQPVEGLAVNVRIGRHETAGSSLAHGAACDGGPVMWVRLRMLGGGSLQKMLHVLGLGEHAADLLLLGELTKTQCGAFCPPEETKQTIILCQTADSEEKSALRFFQGSRNLSREKTTPFQALPALLGTRIILLLF